jgi:phenylpyruvate tautomerase PptA (4-oxalocrotonate tautomerase family)
LNAAAEKMKCTFVANTPENVPANAKYVIVEGVSNLKSVRTHCANAKIYLVISDISDANTQVEYPTIDIYKTGYSNPTDAQKAEKLIKELYYK